METQLRYMSKEELHKMIDEIPEEELMVLTLRKDSGISDNGKMVKKKKTKMFIDRSTLIVLTESNPIRKVDLEGTFYKIPCIKNTNIIKSILLPKLEWVPQFGLGEKLVNIFTWHKRMFGLYYVYKKKRPKNPQTLLAQHRIK